MNDVNQLIDDNTISLNSLAQHSTAAGVLTVTSKLATDKIFLGIDGISTVKDPILPKFNVLHRTVFIEQQRSSWQELLCCSMKTVLESWAENLISNLNE